MVEPPPRERLVHATEMSLRRSGVAGSGLRGLVAEANAPWGSFRHYFPGGKDQLTAEAVTWAGDLAADRVRSYVTQSEAPTARGLFAGLVDRWADDLERHDFALGCPIVGAVADGAEGGSATQEASRRAVELWCGAVTEALSTMGTPADAAPDLATTIFACLEGAIITARATGSAEPLRAVERTLRPLLEPA